MILSALKAYYRLPIQRGKWRITKSLAQRVKGLQSVKVEVPGGEIWVDLRQSSSHSFLMSGPSRSDEQEVMKHFIRPGSVCYDIGAHWGVHSVFMASLGAKVFSFEPCPAVLPSL